MVNKWKSVSETHIFPLDTIYRDHYTSRTIDLVRTDEWDMGWWQRFMAILEPIGEFGTIYLIFIQMTSLMSSYHSIEFMTTEEPFNDRMKFDKWENLG